MPSIVYKLDLMTKSYFNSYREAGMLPPIISGKIKGRLAKEIPKNLNYKDNGVILNGRLDDLFVFENGNVGALDHKTRSKEPEYIHNAHKTQMDIYNFLLQKNNFPTEDKAVLIYYFPDNLQTLLHNGISLNCKVVQVKTNASHAEELLNEACTILDGPMPDSNIDCEFCNWTQNLMENQLISPRRTNHAQ